MEKKEWKDWLLKVGAGTFLFFLIKGLLWLVLFGALAFWKGGC